MSRTANRATAALLCGVVLVALGLAIIGLPDDEIAAVLTYVRNTFGNKAPLVTPAKVKEVREATKSQAGFIAPADLLKQHPHK